MEEAREAVVESPEAAQQRQTLEAIAKALRIDWVQAAIVALLSLIPLAIAAHGRSTAFNNYVRVAYAWIHGRMWLDYPGRWLDAVSYQGHWYGIDAPFPAVLMLPWVWFRGMEANETYMAIALCAIALGVAWVLFTRLGVPLGPRIALTVFLFAGTDLWWCAMLGDVWFMAHISAVCFTFLALLECMGKRRGWLIAMFAIFAFESRFSLVMAMPLYAYLIWTGALSTREASAQYRNRQTAWFAAVLACGVGVWVAYNELMWGTWNDIGHTIYFHQDAYGAKTGSPFSLIYVPYEFYSFFLQGPVFVEWLQRAQWPFFKVDPRGISLTITSPALVLAFFARIPKPLLIALWVTIVLVAGPSFLYYLNGWYQFGMRHALDFEPFLLVLMALAVRGGMPLWGYVLVGWSALVGTWGVWWWDTFMRTGG